MTFIALKEFSHPVTGLKIKAGRIINITCALTINMMLKAGLIQKHGN